MAGTVPFEVRCKRVVISDMTGTAAQAAVRAALRSYRASCPDNTLHTDCPYRVNGKDGPDCERQCEDIIRTLDSDLTATAPFDAAAHLLQELEGPNANWSTVALVRFLADQLLAGRYLVTVSSSGRRTTPFERQVQLTSALARLGERGIGPMVHKGICETASRAMVDLRIGRTDVPTDIQPWGARLDKVLGEQVPDGDPGQMLQTALQLAPKSEFGSEVTNWLCAAHPQSIVLWRFDPNDEHSPAPTPSLADAEMCWFRDRMSTTHLDDWLLESLHLEFRYANDDFQTTLPESLIDERHVPQEPLTLELAKRSSGTKIEQADLDSLGDLAVVSIAELQRGRHEVAAALFDGAAATGHKRLRTSSHKNAAFCRMPVATEAAISFFQSLEGTETDAIVLCNLVVANIALGRLKEAAGQLRLLEACPPGDVVPLWSVCGSGQFELVRAEPAGHARAEWEAVDIDLREGLGLSQLEDISKR